MSNLKADELDYQIEAIQLNKIDEESIETSSISSSSGQEEETKQAIVKEVTPKNVSQFSGQQGESPQRGSKAPDPSSSSSSEEEEKYDDIPLATPMPGKFGQKKMNLQRSKSSSFVTPIVQKNQTDFNDNLKFVPRM